jgi:hypothetical protein
VIRPVAVSAVPTPSRAFALLQSAAASSWRR